MNFFGCPHADSQYGKLITLKHLVKTFKKVFSSTFPVIILGNTNSPIQLVPGNKVYMIGYPQTQVLITIMQANQAIRLQSTYIYIYF